LEGVEHVHSKDIIHRDLKPENLMVDKQGCLRIGDFGSSRKWERGGKFSPEVVTLRYRAPEVLLCAEKYDKAIDMWSVGCIYADMMLGRQLLEGVSEKDQIEKMRELLGSFRERWGPDYAKLPIAKTLNQQPQPDNHLRSVFTAITDQGYDLLNNLLRYNPMRRLNATQALTHAYFKETIVKSNASNANTNNTNNSNNNSNTNNTNSSNNKSNTNSNTNNANNSNTSNVITNNSASVPTVSSSIPTNKEINYESSSQNSGVLSKSTTTSSLEQTQEKK
jgi:serine/threonine protein kinase